MGPEDVDEGVWIASGAPGDAADDGEGDDAGCEIGKKYGTYWWYSGRSTGSETHRTTIIF
jgi:hypothetical protein